MAEKLSEFCKKLIWERKIVRENMGNSIVPLMIIRVITPIVPMEDHWLPQLRKVMLVTVCRKTGTTFVPRANDMFYSAGGSVHYSPWWERAEVVAIRSPRLLSTKSLVEVYIQTPPEPPQEFQDDNQPHPW